MKPSEVPDELQRLIRKTISDPGSVLPRDEMESVPQWTMRAFLAAVLPAHEAMVRAKVGEEIDRESYRVHKVAVDSDSVNELARAVGFARAANIARGEQP